MAISRPGSTLTTPINLEESRAQRLQRQQSRFRDRGGIFVPSERNILADILLGKASPLEKPRHSVSATPTRREKGKDRQSSQGDGETSESCSDLRRSPRKQVRKSAIEPSQTPGPISIGVSLKTPALSAGPKRPPQKSVKAAVAKPVKPVPKAAADVLQPSLFLDDGSESEYLPESKPTIQRKRRISKVRKSSVNATSKSSVVNKKTKTKKKVEPEYEPSDPEAKAPPARVSSAAKHKTTSEASRSNAPIGDATGTGSLATSSRSRSKVPEEKGVSDDEDEAPARTTKTTPRTSGSSTNASHSKSSAPSKKKKAFSELEDIPEEEVETPSTHVPPPQATTPTGARLSKAIKSATVVPQTKKRPRSEDVNPVHDSPEPAPKRARSKQSRADGVPLPSKHSKSMATGGVSKEGVQASREAPTSDGAASKKRQREPEDGGEEYTDTTRQKPSTKRKKLSPGNTRAKTKAKVLDEAADEPPAKSKPKPKPAAARKAAPKRKRKENSAGKSKTPVKAAIPAKAPPLSKGPPKSVLLRIQNSTRNVADNEPDPIDFLS